jgi:hypothetical protein
MAVPDYPCDEADYDKLYPNPADPHSFYQCTPEGLQLMPCPAGMVFDPEASSTCAGRGEASRGSRRRAV